MDIYLSVKGWVEILMIIYLVNIIDAFTDQIELAGSIPTSDKLFYIGYEIVEKFLPDEQVVAFHHIVTQVLFIFTIAGKDIKQ